MAGKRDKPEEIVLKLRHPLQPVHWPCAASKIRQRLDWPDLTITRSTEQRRYDFREFRRLCQLPVTKVDFAWHLRKEKWRTRSDSNARPSDS